MKAAKIFTILSKASENTMSELVMYHATSLAMNSATPANATVNWNEIFLFLDGLMIK